MKSSIRQLFLGAAVACFFTLTLAALAEDNKQPAPPAAAEKATATVTETVVTPPAAPAAQAPATAKSESIPAVTSTAATPAEEKAPELRRIDQEPKPATPSRSRTSRPPRVRVNSGSGNERVSIASDARLGAGEKADAVVAIAGNATSEGEVADAVVAILGNAKVAAGSVGDAVVAVMGNTYVNTKIGGEAVAVMGNIELGPEADIGGDVVAVGGAVHRDPKAVVRGNVQNVSVAGKFPALGGLHTWFRECALWGRPLAFKPGLEWVWGLTLAFFALYVVFALVFGPAVDKCAVTLETRPGGSILTAFLTILLTPVLVVLLCITVVGIVAVPFLVIGLILAALFGKAVMLAWLGRRFTKFFGPGLFSHAAFATLVGGAIVLLLYTVPFVGFVIQKSFDVLGIGVVVYTLMLASKRNKPAAPVPPAAPAPSAPVYPPGLPLAPGGGGVAMSGMPSGETVPPAVSGFAAPPVSPGFGTPNADAGAGVPPSPAPFAAPPAASAAVPLSAATLPRAGFWIRLGALALDAVLIGIIAGMTHLGPKFFLLGIAAYAAMMWKLKGTTIGGIVCGLKVVRLDGREVDWGTAIVRALGCFLSLAVAGLGFIWVAVDDEKQSWHDKIAGTTVVEVPKGVSLL